MPPRAPTTLAEPGRSSAPAAPQERTAGGASDAEETPPPPHDDEDLRDVPAELRLLIAALARTPEVDLDAAFAEERTGRPITGPVARLLRSR